MLVCREMICMGCVGLMCGEYQGHHVHPCDINKGGNASGIVCMCWGLIDWWVVVVQCTQLKHWYDVLIGLRGNRVLPSIHQRGTWSCSYERNLPR